MPPNIRGWLGRLRSWVAEHPWPLWLLFFGVLRMMERGLPE